MNMSNPKSSPKANAPLVRKIESLLFVASRPLNLKKIAEEVGGEKNEVK